MWVTAEGDDSILDVWVVPGASRSSVDGAHGDALKVRVAAPPERGRANQALVDLIARRLDTEVTLVAGGTGRRKRLRAARITPDAVRIRLTG